MNLRIPYRMVIANLFYLFLSSPILSPSIAGAEGSWGTTFYLYWIIPLFDKEFVSFWIHQIRYRLTYNFLWIAAVFLSWLIIKEQYIVVIRIAMIFYTVLYIKYSIDNGLFYLFRWINVNIFIGIIQYTSFYLAPSLYEILTPTAMASTLWGEHAIYTFTNTEGGFDDLVDGGISTIRISGLSGEGGFFCTILFTSLVMAFIQLNGRMLFWQSIVIIVGIFLSLSKVIIVFFPCLLIYRFRKYINKIPMLISIIIWGVVMSGIGYFTLEYLWFSETFMHRFAGYTAINNLDFENILVGLQKGTVLSSSLFLNVSGMEFFPYRFNSFCGYPMLVVSIGYIGIILVLILLHTLRFQSAGILFILLTSITTSLLNIPPHIILAWYIAMNISSCDDTEKGIL